MQNDLISRSALIEELEKELDKCKEVNFMSVWSRAMRIVNGQPLGYNLAKVIEQLDKEETEWCDKYCEEKAKGNIDLYVDGFGEGLTRALQIVRKGGVDNAG